jgi:hypothetical protein
MRLALYTVGGLLAVALLVPLLRTIPRTESAVAQAPTVTTSPTPSPSPIASTKRFKLRLTLSNPTDLKVREGDRIAAGQILADRATDRQRLDYQKAQLQLQIKKLQQPVTAPPPAREVPEIAVLPSPSFLSEVAEVERQKVLVGKADRLRTMQQRKLDLLESLPQNELPEATLPHEREVLADKQREFDQAQAELDIATAKVGQAQKEREYREYLHSLEVAKRAISLQQQELQRQQQLQHQEDQERDRSFKLAQLQAQLQQLETQLLDLAAIRSPYSGTIQRLKFEGQSDRALVVELTLAISGNKGRGAVPAVTGAPEANRGATRQVAPSAADGKTNPTSAGAE